MPFFVRKDDIFIKLPICAVPFQGRHWDSTGFIDCVIVYQISMTLFKFHMCYKKTILKKSTSKPFEILAQNVDIEHCYAEVG